MSSRRGLVGGLLVLGGCSLLELPADGVPPIAAGGNGGSAGGQTVGSSTGGTGGEGGDGGAPGAPDGAVCSGDPACESGHCVEGLCCESACTESCRRCDTIPGTCAPIEAGSSCDDGGRCDGAGVCTTGRLRAARMYGAEGRDLAPAIVDDGSGGVLWLGVTDSDELDVGGQIPVNHLVVRNQTAFATRASLDGNTVAVSSFGGAGNLTVVHDAVTDVGQGLVVAARLDGTLFSGAVSATGGDPVFVRLDANLSYGWHVTVATDASSGSLRIADRPGGGFVATGSFSGDATLGGTTLPASSEESMFVVRADPGGQAATLWTPATTGSGITRVTAVDVDPSGRIWLGGYFTVATIDLGGGQAASNTAGEDAFVAALDADFTPLWIHAWGGAGDQRVEDLAVDASGRAWIGGSFTDAITIGETMLTATTPGMWDAYWAQLAPDGEATHIRAVEPLSLEVPAGLRLGVDGQENAAVAVRLGASPVDLGLGEVTPGPGASYLLAKIAPTGEPLWSRPIASTDAPSGDEALVVTDVAGLADGSVAVAGEATTDVVVGSTVLTADPTALTDDELWFALFQP